MTKPPWRAQDIPDAILGRATRPTLPAVSLLDDLAETDEEFEVDADEVYVIVLDTDSGPQPLVWPMRLHIHGQNCGRA
jgi:hypothetical protein